jgi:hypothetical protein
VQGKELRQDVENRIIFTNFSLVLQRIGRERSGSYACESSNRVGRGQSQDLLLDVKCKGIFDNFSFFSPIVCMDFIRLLNLKTSAIWLKGGLVALI